MKKIFLILSIILASLYSNAQYGGQRNLITQSNKIVHSDLKGNENILIRIDSNGNEHKLFLDFNSIYIENDTLKGASQFVLPTASTTILGGVKVDGNTITINNGVISGASSFNYTPQTLTGTTPTWNVSNGIHAKITLAGNTTITLSNLVSGTTGNLTVTNPSTGYIITVSGYTNKISQTIYYATNQFYTSGASKIDVYSWYYDGTYLIWNGGLDYK